MFMSFATMTPMQWVWSIFAIAVIVLLFILYHLHLEKKHGKKK